MRTRCWKETPRTRWSNKSPRCFSSELFWKGSVQSSEHNSRLRRIWRKGEQQRFRSSSCPKNCSSLGVCFLWTPMTALHFQMIWQGLNNVWGFYCGRTSRLLFQKCEKCQRFFAAMSKPQATTLSVQSEHPVAAAAKIGHISIFFIYFSLFIRYKTGVLKLTPTSKILKQRV